MQRPKSSNIRITGGDWIDPQGLPTNPGAPIDLSKLPNPPKPKIKTGPTGPTLSPRETYERQQAEKLNPNRTVATPQTDEDQPDPDVPRYMAPNNSPHHKAAREQLVKENRLPALDDGPQPLPKSSEPSDDLLQTVINTDPRYVTVPQNVDVRYTRVSLPSKFIFYPFDDLQMRPFEVRDLSKLSRAQAEDNLTILIDVMDGVIDQDIRMLSVADFYYLMYMIRIWSYPRSPFTLKWRSKYGNNNEHTINQTNLKIKFPKIDADQYQAWVDRGYTIPTVRDMEIFQTETLDPEFKWQYERAQYLVGATIKEKVERLNQPDGIALLEDIRDFSQLLDHGVDETLELADRAYNPHQQLADMAQRMEQLTALGLKKNPETQSMFNHIKQEHDILEKKLRSRMPVVADTEVIRISIDVMTFFPNL